QEKILTWFGMRGSDKLAVTEVALVVTIGEPGCDFPQVAFPHGLTAQLTERFCARTDPRPCKELCRAWQEGSRMRITRMVQSSSLPSIPHSLGSDWHSASLFAFS